MKKNDILDNASDEDFSYQLPLELQQFLIDPNITELKLSNQNYGGLYHLINDVLHYRDFYSPQEKSKLITLTLDGTSISQDDFDSLDEIIKNSPFCTTLDLSNNHFGLTGIEKVFKSIRHSNIKVLLLRNVSASLNFEFLAFYFENSHLSYIDFSLNDLEQNQEAELQKILGNREQDLEIRLDDKVYTVVKAKEMQKLVSQSARRKRNFSQLKGKADNDDRKSYAKQSTIEKQSLAAEKTQKSFLDCLSLFSMARRELIEASILEQFIPYDEQLCDSTKNNLLYRSDCRQFNPPYPSSLFDSRFLSASINQFESGYFICEGPENEDAVERLLTELFEERLPVKIILTIGEPDQGENYFNYFNQERSYNNFIIKPLEKNQTHPHVHVYELIITDTNTQTVKNITQYYVKNRTGNESFIWDELDNQLFYNLSIEAAPENILIHCDTGISYAPMVALSMQLFRDFTVFFSGSNQEVTTKILNELMTLRKRINLALLPSESFLLNALRLAFCYADIHCKNIASEAMMPCIHKNIPIEKLGLLCSRNDILISSLENMGIKSIFLDFVADDSIEVPLHVESLALKIKQLFVCDNLTGVLITHSIPELDEIVNLLDLLPANLGKFYLAEGNNCPEQIARKIDVIVQNTNLLPAICYGISKGSSVTHSPALSGSTVLIGPRHFYQINPLRDLENQAGNQLHRLLNTECNYELIPYLIQNEGTRLIIEAPELEMTTDQTAKIQLKTTPKLGLSSQTNCSYYLALFYLDYIVVESEIRGRQCCKLEEGGYQIFLHENELFAIGEMLAEKANLLADYFKVKIILPDNLNSEMLNKYPSKLLDGIKNKIRSFNMISTMKIDAITMAHKWESYRSPFSRDEAELLSSANKFNFSAPGGFFAVSKGEQEEGPLFGEGAPLVEF